MILHVDKYVLDQANRGFSESDLFRTFSGCVQFTVDPKEFGNGALLGLLCAIFRCKACRSDNTV